MTLTIQLPSELEQRLIGAADQRGVAPEEFVRDLIREHLPPNAGPSLADLFAQWEAEEHTDDPAELARRNQEVEDFKRAMNQNRREMEGPGSRVPYP